MHDEPHPRCPRGPPRGWIAPDCSCRLGIADVPDYVTSAALALIVNAAGTTTAKITALLTAEEIDAATKKTATYRPPGQ